MHDSCVSGTVLQIALFSDKFSAVTKLECKNKEHKLNDFQISNELRFTVSLVYYGLTLNVAALSGDVYLNSFLTGAVEIPGNLLAMYCMDKIGRRITLGASFIICGVMCLLMIAVQDIESV